MPESILPLMAVVTHTRSPHTTGLECPKPAIGVFHRTPSPRGTFHFVAVAYPSATPAARMPRNEGQSTPGRGSVADWMTKPEPSTHAANVTHRRFIDSPPAPQV